MLLIDTEKPKRMNSYEIPITRVMLIKEDLPKEVTSKLEPGGGVHNMLRVQVCAAHMGGFLGPEFSKQGSIFRQIFHKQGWIIKKLAKNSKKMGGFSPKFTIKVGMTASFGN